MQSFTNLLMMKVKKIIYEYIHFDLTFLFSLCIIQIFWVYANVLHIN